MSNLGKSIFVWLLLAIAWMFFRLRRGATTQYPLNEEATQAAARLQLKAPAQARRELDLDGAVEEAFRSLAAEMGEPGVSAFTWNRS